MSAQHTPGPWVAYVEPTRCEGVNVRFEIRNKVARGICDGQSQEHLTFNGIKEDECRANARLIAAAPELLDALARLVGQCDRLRLPGQAKTDAEKNAEAVIAKATAWSAPTVQHMPSEDTEGGEI